jgi:phenylacetate-coenzyme A ligase PaaK-like adenylate-forming protein
MRAEPSKDQAHLTASLVCGNEYMNDIKWHSHLEKIRGYQLSRIRRIVNYAYENVPLYRRKYDAAGIKPNDIRSFDDFQHLPLLTKEELQAGFPGKILSKKINPQSCYVVSTSGHSGSPVKLYRRKRELWVLPLAYFLAFPLLPRLLASFSGVKAGRRISVILPQDESYDLYRAVQSFAFIPPALRRNLQYIATETDVAEQITALARHKPDVIGSDLTALKNLAIYSAASGTLLREVKLLLVGSELIDGNSRRLVEEAFKGKLIEHYGSEEAGTIAIGCPRGDGLHLLWRTNFIETLDSEQKPCRGAPGQLVVTNLLNIATPVIRYSGMRDTVTMSTSPCSCAVHSEHLKVVDGRIVDSFQLPDGRIVHPFALTIPMERIPGIMSYQIRQEQSALVRVLLVTGNIEPGVDETTQNDMVSNVKSRLGAILGDQVNIEVEFRNKLIPDDGNRSKMRPVISLINR